MIYMRSAMNNRREGRASALRTICAALLVGLGAFGVRAATDQPKQVIQEAMDEVVAVLKSESVSKEQRREKIESIAYARFDFDYMSQLVLAKNLKQLSPEQKKLFAEEFRKHLSITYGRRLNSYTDEKINVLSARDEKNKQATVKTQIVGGAAGSGIDIDYRLRESEGNWRVIDVIIERVSLIQSFKSQVQDIISGKGIDSLIEILRQKNAKDAAAAPA